MDSETKIRHWFQTQGIHSVTLQRRGGLTNHVYLAEIDKSAGNNLNQHQFSQKEFPHKVIVRMAISGLQAQLSPLADTPESVIGIHQLAYQLGLAPEVIGADIDAKLLCLAYEGEVRTLQAEDMMTVKRYADTMHNAAADWQEIIPKPILQIGDDEMIKQALSWSGLPNLFHQQKNGMSGQSPFIQQLAAELMDNAISQNIYQLPLLPSHSDWNRGNWIHNGERWWLIDWDFAGWRPALWDWAGMVVEHQWSLPQAMLMFADKPIKSTIDVDKLPWFCACISLVNLDWHIQRGSDACNVQQSEQQLNYWSGLIKK